MRSETYESLLAISQHLDERFPDGNEIFQRVSRLTEEVGELATAVNHAEGMGVKRAKHGDPDANHMAGEIRDVLVATLSIARHYQLEGVVKDLAQSHSERIADN